jgi:multisubunit Na+/H+ antiporter MnhB subunit
MRALGVRPDVAFPGLVYSLTTPLVQPFYRYFPLPAPYGARFDIAVVETASLAAVGAVFLVVLAIYVLGLMLFSRKT